MARTKKVSSKLNLENGGIEYVTHGKEDMPWACLTYRVVLSEESLGTTPPDKNIFDNYIASNAPEAEDKQNELDLMDTSLENTDVEGKTTIFQKDENGNPYSMSYQMRGFIKGTIAFMKRIKSNSLACSTLSAHKKVVDGDVFVYPKIIKYNRWEKIETNQRPLRINGPTGERSALAASESIGRGSWFQFGVVCPTYLIQALHETIQYGLVRGFSCWANGGKGVYVSALKSLRYMEHQELMEYVRRINMSTDDTIGIEDVINYIPPVDPIYDILNAPLDVK